MTPNINPKLTEEAVAANVIEVFLGIDDAQLVARHDDGSVSVDSLRGQSVPGRIHNQRQTIPNNKPRIHAPGCRISKARNGITAIRNPHRSIFNPLQNMGNFNNAT
jgi:hypothetical protein